MEIARLKRLKNTLTSALMCAALFGSGLDTGLVNAAPSKTTTPRAAAKLEQIELVHQLGPDAGARLATLVERYNATGPAVRVTLSSRDWRQGAAPELMILNSEDQAAFLSSRPGPRPLHEVMTQAGEALETLRPHPTMTSAPLDAQNRLVGLPIALATPVMFYNKALLRAAGANPDNPPTTWQDLQVVLGKLYDKGITCPYASAYPVWIHLENTSAWHNEPLTHGNNTLAINGMLQVKHLALMSSWYKSRYMHLFGRGNEADAHFMSGECAVLTSASSAYPLFASKPGLEVGVAPLPYHEDYYGAPQNTVSDGPSLWVSNGKTDAHYRAAARFIKFLLTAESQVELQRLLGGLPVNRAGVYAAKADALRDELAGVRVAITTLTHKPVTESSRARRALLGVDQRRFLNEALDDLWSNRKPAKQVLDEAVARSRQSYGGPSLGRR